MIILRQKEFVNAKYKGTATPDYTRHNRNGDLYIINPSDPKHIIARERVKNGEDEYEVLDDVYGEGASNDPKLIANLREK